MNSAARSTARMLAITALVFVGSLACNTVTRLFETSGAREVRIPADQGWQPTVVDITRGQRVTVEVVSGRWFEDPPGVWHDAAGEPNARRCGKRGCHEPLPDFPKYALISRVGQEGELLGIGEQLEFVAQQSGSLYLRPNYDVESHGNGVDRYVCRGPTIRRSAGPDCGASPAAKGSQPAGAA